MAWLHGAPGGSSTGHNYERKVCHLSVAKGRFGWNDVRKTRDDQHPPPKKKMKWVDSLGIDEHIKIYIYSDIQ